MILKTDKPLSEKMLPFKLGAGDMAVFQLIRVRQGNEPPFVYMLNGRQTVYDPFNDDFIEAWLVNNERDQQPVAMVPVQQGIIVLNGNNPAHRELFKFLMISDMNENKPFRNTAVTPVFYIMKLIIDNEHVEVTPEGRLVSKGADMIKYQKRRTPHNIDKESSVLDRLSIDGDAYEKPVAFMTEDDAKKLLYRVVSTLYEDGLIHAHDGHKKGIVTVVYRDEGGEERPLMSFEARGKGVWLNTMKSRLWKNRISKPKVVARVLAANDAVTQQVLYTMFNGKYDMDSLIVAFPALQQELKVKA